MTLALRYAVRSDVGLLREGNEDSAYAGPRLLAVADGMGGHAAGEVASAVAISTLTGLDDDMPANELQLALADAVTQANRTLHDMVVADPSIGGMGTTLTAMLWSGSRVALCLPLRCPVPAAAHLGCRGAEQVSAHDTYGRDDEQPQDGQEGEPDQGEGERVHRVICPW